MAKRLGGVFNSFDKTLSRKAKDSINNLFMNNVFRAMRMSCERFFCLPLCLSQFVSLQFSRQSLSFLSTIGEFFELISRTASMTNVNQLSTIHRSLSINKSFVLIATHSQLVKSWFMHRVKQKDEERQKVISSIEQSLKKHNNLIKSMISGRKVEEEKELKLAAPSQRYCSCT